MSEKENPTTEPEQQEENPSEEEQPPKEEQRDETPPQEEDQKPREEKPAEQERKPEEEQKTEEPKPEDKPGEEKPAKGETVVKTLTLAVAAGNADNKGVILDEMKKSKEKLKLEISIEKKLVRSSRWLCCIPPSTPTFSLRDLRKDGPVAKIIKDSLIHVFNKRLGSRQMEFTVLGLTPKNKSCSLLRFEMKICGKDGSPLPPHLSDESSEETKNIEKEFISLVKAGIIHLKYEDDENADIEVNIHEWQFGSIIIEGTVLYINGNFKEEQQDDILSIIKKAGESVFNSVYIQLLNPSIDFVVSITADIEVMKYIKENEKALEVDFLEKLNSIVTEGMKEDKDKVTLSQNLEKGFVSKVPFEKDEEIFKK